MRFNSLKTGIDRLENSKQLIATHRAEKNSFCHIKALFTRTT